MVENNENEPYITGAFPNILELRSMWETARSEDILLNSSYWWRIVDTFGSDLHRVLTGQVRGDMLFLLNDGIIQMATQLLPFVKNFVIKCGSKGVVLVSHVASKEAAIDWISEGSQPKYHQIVSRASDGSALVVRHFPAYALPQGLSTINVTGAGDTLVGALLAAMSYKNNIFSSPADISQTIGLGQRCAIETIKSPFAVAPSISLIK
ncbi:hypothetical protein FRC12_009828 [Ceratobasidium sp. 428]|nr:hypothetical protein FRC12_009828 [Ceratobasidium sp. 428]